MQLLSKIFALLWLDIFTRSSNVAAAVADKMKVIVESTHCRKSLEGLSKEEAQMEGGEGQRKGQWERERNVEDGEKGLVGEKKVRKEVWDKKEEERKYERRNDK